jgi:hypothetical protein
MRTLFWAGTHQAVEERDLRLEVALRGRSNNKLSIYISIVISEQFVIYYPAVGNYIPLSPRRAIGHCT